MLAEVKTPHANFAALCSYLLRGKPGTTPNPKRVAWTMTQNLHTDTPEHAAKVMDATALLSPRVQKPTYHAMIAWHINETPSPEEMQHIALRTLQMMGLEEHQALIVGHGDTAHRHLHMAINRVHPGTGRAWKTSHDFLRLDRVMKALADEHCFTYVPSHRFNVGDAAVRERTRGLTKATYNLAKRDGKKLLPQWSKAQSESFGLRCQADVEKARSWDELANVFAQHNLNLQAKGQGLVLMGGESYTKLSALGSFARVRTFAERFNETFADYLARSASLDELEPDEQTLNAFPPPKRRRASSEAPKTAPPSPTRLDPARINTLAIEATQHFRSAYSWADLSQRLKPLGIELTPKGRGLVFTHGAHTLPFRKLAPDHTIKELHQRFHETFYRYRRRLEHQAMPQDGRPKTRHHHTGQALTPPPSRANPVPAPKTAPTAKSPAAEPLAHHPQIFSVDGVDITRALATLGLATRSDVIEAIESALRDRELRQDTDRPSIADLIERAVRPFIELSDIGEDVPAKPAETPKPPAPENNPEIEDDEPEPSP